MMGYAEAVQPTGEMKSTYLNYNPSENVHQRDTILPFENTKTKKSRGLMYFFRCCLPLKQVGEMRLEKIWLQNRNKAVQEKREYEELENHILNWANNKGLLEQDINRQNELTAVGSKFENIGDHLPVNNLLNSFKNKDTYSKLFINFVVVGQSSIPKEELNEKNC